MPLEYASNAALTGDFDEKVQLISDTLRRPVCEDAVLRRFCVLGRRAALFYIDGMADDNKLLRGVIAPCQQARDMEWSQDTLLGEILSIPSATPTTRLPTAIGSLMNGDALLLCEEIDGAIALDAKGFAKRGVQRTTGELVVQGPQEAFSESLRDNVVLLRRMMRTPALVSEAASVGSRVPARVCILYLDGVARKENIDEIKRRLDGCNVDYVSSLGMLEQLLEDSPYSLMPQIVTTERPDRAVSFLLSGQILLGLENAPQMLSMPMNMAELFHAPDDSSLRWQYGAPAAHAGPIVGAAGAAHVCGADQLSYRGHAAAAADQRAGGAIAGAHRRVPGHHRHADYLQPDQRGLHARTLHDGRQPGRGQRADPGAGCGGGRSGQPAADCAGGAQRPGQLCDARLYLVHRPAHCAIGAGGGGGAGGVLWPGAVPADPDAAHLCPNQPGRAPVCALCPAPRAQS